MVAAQAARPGQSPARRLLPVAVARRILSWLLALAVLGCIGFLAFAWRPAIAPVAQPQRSAFEPGRIARGAQLAALGYCASCHTTAQGAPLAGGVPLQSPFGTLYGSNITPSAAQGIGRWSLAAFTRAMREGVARDGSHLYPAFPYDHFRHTSDDELQSLYAYLMTREPVDSRPPANALAFPLGFRPLLAGWKLLFLRDEPAATADGTRSAEWQRGAHLVQSLSHCGGCHTPRNALAAEERGRPLDGNRIEGWYAPPLNHRSPSPLPWQVPELVDYLRSGLAQGHAMAGGPMQQVVASLSQADPADVRAIAVYVVSQMAPAAPDAAGRQARATASVRRAAGPLAAAQVEAQDDQLQRGATVYAQACAVCHDLGRSGPASDNALRLPLAVALYDEDPASLLRIVREGIPPAGGQRGRWMPAFGNALSDAQITALAAYLRRAGADQAPWPRLDAAVKDSRR